MSPTLLPRAGTESLRIALIGEPACAAPTLAALASAGDALVRVTNQAGLAHGHYTRARRSPSRTPQVRCTHWEEVARAVLAQDARSADRSPHA